MSDATPVRPMTAEDWAKAKTAARNAIGEAQELANVIDGKRPEFSFGKFGAARVADNGGLWIFGPTFEARLTPERARELARWIDEVFPAATTGPQLVRDYYKQARGYGRRCESLGCNAPVCAEDERYCEEHADGRGCPDGAEKCLAEWSYCPVHSPEGRRP